MGKKLPIKFFLFFTVVIHFFCHTCGQDLKKADSLKNVLHTNQPDTTKAIAILKLSRLYKYNNPDSSLFYSNAGLEMIKNPDVRTKFAEACNHLLNSFEMRLYSNIGSVLGEERSDVLAVKMTLRAIQLAEKSKDKNDALGEAYFGAAEMYQFIEEPSTAIIYWKKILTIDTSARGLVDDKVEMAACFFDAGEYDSALSYLIKLDPALTIDNGNLWPYPHLYLGKVYAQKGKYKEALDAYRTAINYASRSGYFIDLCMADLGIASVFRTTGASDSAQFYAKQAFDIANSILLPDRVMEASSFLSAFYDSVKMKDSALKYLKISVRMKDSLYSRERIKRVQNFTFEEQLRQEDIREQETNYKNKIRTYALIAGILVLSAIAFIVTRNNRRTQRLYSQLRDQNTEIQNTLKDLRDTQSQLIQSEKMASLGELTAGIAHEIQNPLNFVNNFSEVNTELIDELEQEADKGNISEVKSIVKDIKENEQKINHHGKRADAIVKGMLQHSRSSTGVKGPTDINALADEYFRLAYHGLRAKEKNFNATMKTDFDSTIGKINIIPQDIGRVLLNLYNNAFYAVNEKIKQNIEGYEPTVLVSTKKTNDKVVLTVMDNGNGIPQKVIDKIFQPFFTTKPTGQGTGLGLSLSYDIIKAHGGEIKVETKEGEFTEFNIILPV